MSERQRRIRSQATAFNLHWGTTRPLAPRHCPYITFKELSSGCVLLFSRIHGTPLPAKAAAAAHMQMKNTFLWQAPHEKSKAVCTSPWSNGTVRQPWERPPSLTSVSLPPRWDSLQRPGLLANAGASFLLAEDMKDEKSLLCIPTEALLTS